MVSQIPALISKYHKHGKQRPKPGAHCDYLANSVIVTHRETAWPKTGIKNQYGTTSVDKVLVDGTREHGKSYIMRKEIS